MKVISFKIRGVGGALKILALQCLFEIAIPNTIFVQEKMVEGVKARAAFSKILKDWFMCSVDSVGKLGELLSAWNPHVINASPFLSSIGIWLEGRVIGWDRPVNLFNCYGTYQNR